MDLEELGQSSANEHALDRGLGPAQSDLRLTDAAGRVAIEAVERLPS